MKTSSRWIAFTAAILMVASCGKKTEGGEPGEPEALPAAAPTGAATAEQVAREQRGRVNCPARVATPAGAAGSPKVDVVGVRPGLTYDEAVNLVLCDNPMLVAVEDKGRGYNIETHGQTYRQGFTATFAEPRVVLTGEEVQRQMQQDFMDRANNSRVEDMKPGQVKYYVATMGLPGQERVVQAQREEWFAEGRNPTVDAVALAMLGKYGTPTSNEDQGNSRLLRWAYDPSGRLVTETSPLFNTCYGVSDPDQSSNLSPDCGVVVAARLNYADANKGLAKSIQVGVIDQAGGYRAIEATEQAFAGQDAARQTQEVNAAASNADKPKL